MHDMVPDPKRSIRQIPLPKNRRAPTAEEELAASDDSSQPRRRRRGSGRSRTLLWLVGGIIAVLGIVVGASVVWSGAKVTIAPKEQDVPISGTFGARREGANLNQLPYEVMTLQREGTRTVPATGEQYVDRKATGRIVIYNDYSTAPQRLVANTRFEGIGGLVYRINQAVSVPGKTANAPGSIEVDVTADQPGEKYNIGLSDFTIPGFKGSAQFEKFYARSKTPMTGGFSGNAKTVAPAERETALNELGEELRAELAAEATAQKPDGTILLPDGDFLETQVVSEKPVDAGVEIAARSIGYYILVKEADLAQFVARQGIPRFDGAPVSLTNIGDITFAVASKKTIKPWSEAQFSFQVAGTAHLVWQVNTEQLKSDLSGREKGAINQILPGYPAIENAKIVLRPFWRSTFPDNPNEITVVLRSDR